MKVWFVAFTEQEECDEEPYSYDNFMDSGLFVSEEAAEREADRIYEEQLQREAENYQRRISRYNARRKAYDLLAEAGMENIKDVFYFDPEEEHPDFSEPERRPVYWLDVAE